MQPLVMGYNYYGERQARDQVFLYGLLYFVSGIVGSIIICKIILSGCGRLKYWAIFVATMSCLFSETAHLLAWLVIE